MPENPPNSGNVTAGVGIKVNNTLIDFTAVNGLAIPSDVRVTASNTPATSGSAYAALMIGGTQRLYSIDLVTGASVEMGVLAMTLSGLAVGQVAVK